MSSLAYRTLEKSHDAARSFGRARAAAVTRASQESDRERMSRRIAEAESTLARGYDIARPNPNIPWHAYSSKDANDEILGAMVQARQLVRDSIRNDSLAQHAVRLWRGTIWGRGIIPRCDSQNEDDDVKEALDNRVQKIFDKHFGTGKCHVGGTLSIYQMFEQGLETVCSDGEFLWIKHYRDEAYTRRFNLPLPVQYEPVEPEMIATHVKEWPTRGGGKDSVVNGVVIDRYGNRRGILLHEEKPAYAGAVGPVRFIPIEFVIHFFRVTRPGQQRGISAFVGSVQTLWDLGDLSDATLKSAKLSAALMLILGVVPESGFEDNQIGAYDGWDEGASGGEIRNGMDPRTPDYRFENGHSIEDIHGTPIARLHSGMVARVPKGTDVNKIEPEQSGGYEAFEKSAIRRFAAGPGILYEALSQNWSDSNYASYRGAMIPVRREASSWRDMLVERVLQPHVWRDVIVGGYIMNAWGFEGYWSEDEITEEEVVFVMPKEETVDPEKDAKARKVQLETGEEDLESILVQNGTTLRERFRSIAKARKLAEKYGVTDYLDARIMPGYRGNATPQPANDGGNIE